MRILFLSPPSKNDLFPPLGIAYITALLNKNNHEAIIKEGNNSSFKELLEAVRKTKPDIVGITMNTNTRFVGLKIAKEIKEKYKIPIVLGGPHPTLMTDQILKNYPFVDYIVRNEGEYTTLNLLDCLEKKTELKKVKGISYRTNGEIIHNENAEPIIDLDSLPYPEYKFFNLAGYSKNPEHPKELLKYPVGSIISSRGCPYRCTFCSSSIFWGSKIRFRKPQCVVDEMEQLYNKYNTKYIVFNDDNFTTDKKRTIEICKLIIKKGLDKKIAWLCRAEVNIVDLELLTWLKKANCHTIEYGVEDASPEGLKFFKKAHTMEQAYKAFELTNQIGLATRSYFIIGGDHETPENIELKKRAIEKLNPTITTASLLIAYPGTEIYEIGKKRRLWDDSIWLKPCIGKNFHNHIPIYPSKNMSLGQLFSASADIDYWWNRKKGNFSLKVKIKTLKDLLRKRDFSKIYWMSKSVLLRSLNGS
ncbi:MAG: radical SAM protein [Candidatus Pacearchaeota archaeon]